MLLAFGISQKRKADSESEKTVSFDQPAQKKVKPILVQALHQILAYFSHSG